MKKKVLFAFVAIVMSLFCLCSCAKNKYTAIPYYDTLDGKYDTSLMSKNLLKISEGDPGALWVDKEDDPEYGGYCYVAVTTINNKLKKDEYPGFSKAGFEMYRSADLSSWESCGAIEGSCLGITSSDWIDTWTWAPELYRDDETGMYFLYFSASAEAGNPNVSPSTAYMYDRMYLGIAMSETPVGPYKAVTSKDYYSLLADKDGDGNPKVQDGYLLGKNGERITTVNGKGEIENLNGEVITDNMPPVNFGSDAAKKYIDGMNENNVWPCIDASFFKDETTGKMYMYFVSHLSSYKESISTAENNYNKNEIWGLEMKDFITPDYSTLRLLSYNGYKSCSAEDRIVEENGETYRKVNVDPRKYTLNDRFIEIDEDATVNEGPFVLQHGGKYYLYYAPCGTGSIYYAICQSVSDSPLGPFVKLTDTNPVIGVNETNDYMTCTGHNSFVEIGNELYAVYHCNWGETKQYGRCIAVDRVQFMYNEELGYDILYGNGPTLSVQPAPESYTGYTNVAKTAEITVKGGNKDTVKYLTDGLFTVQPWTWDREYTAEEETTITLTWAKPQEVSAVFVYNSADYFTAFNKVDNITFVGATAKDNAVIRDLFCNDENVNENDLCMRQGGAAVASFKPLKIKKMTIKVSSKYTYEYEDGRDGRNKTVNISELYIMGKEAA